MSENVHNFHEKPKKSGFLFKYLTELWAIVE